MFREALAVYDANNALVSNESPFLRDYIRLYAELQSIAAKICLKRENVVRRSRRRRFPRRSSLDRIRAR